MPQVYKMAHIGAVWGSTQFTDWQVDWYTIGDFQRILTGVMELNIP